MNRSEQDKCNQPNQDLLVDHNGLLIADFLVIRDVSTQQILVAQRNRRG